MLSREEIEGELRDVFAKMSPVELERELNGAWRELVEEELANRREASRLEASARDARRNPCSRKVSREKPPSTRALLLSTPLHCRRRPSKQIGGSRIAGFFRSILKKKHH